MNINLLDDGRAIDAESNLSVGIWQRVNGYIRLHIPYVELVYKAKPATHKAVSAELRSSRYLESAVYDPATMKFTVKHIEQ